MQSSKKRKAKEKACLQDCFQWGRHFCEALWLSARLHMLSRWLHDCDVIRRRRLRTWKRWREKMSSLARPPGKVNVFFISAVPPSSSDERFFGQILLMKAGISLFACIKLARCQNDGRRRASQQVAEHYCLQAVSNVGQMLYVEKLGVIGCVIGRFSSVLLISSVCFYPETARYSRPEMHFFGYWIGCNWGNSWQITCKLKQINISYGNHVVIWLLWHPLLFFEVVTASDMLRQHTLLMLATGLPHIKVPVHIVCSIHRKLQYVSE